MLTLTKDEGIKVCIAFLKQYYDRTQPNETGKLFVALENQVNPSNEEKIIYSEWENSLTQITSKRSINTLSTYTEKEIFETFFLFLTKRLNLTARVVAG